MSSLKEIDTRLMEIKKEIKKMEDLDKPEGSIMKKKFYALLRESGKLLDKREEILERIRNAALVKSGGKRKTKRVSRKSSKKSKTAKKSKTSKKGRKSRK